MLKLFNALEADRPQLKVSGLPDAMAIPVTRQAAVLSQRLRCLANLGPPLAAAWEPKAASRRLGRRGRGPRSMAKIGVEIWLIYWLGVCCTCFALIQVNVFISFINPSLILIIIYPQVIQCCLDWFPLCETFFSAALIFHMDNTPYRNILDFG